MGEGELSFGIVHNHDVAHARGGRAAGDWPAIKDKDFQSGAGAGSGAGSANDSGTNDDEVEGLTHGGQVRMRLFSLFVKLRSVADAPAEGIPFVEQQRGFGIHESGASDGRSNFARSAIKPAKSTSESTAENAFLNPRLVFFEFLVGSKAREFGAGAGAARGTIECFAGTLNKIAGMRAGNGRWTEKFDVINFRKALIVDRLANAPTEFSELFSIGERQVVSVLFGEEKPVATPRDITPNGTHAGNLSNKGFFRAPTRNVDDGDFAIFMKGRRDDANRCLDAMLARTNAAHVSESRDQPNGSVTAHAQITDVVEENDAGDTGGIGWFEKRCADNNIGATRFVYDSGAEGVVLIAENVKSIGHRPTAKVGSAADDNARRFPAGMRVYDGNALHGGNEE
jgi:hypothetical protein